VIPSFVAQVEGFVVDDDVGHLTVSALTIKRRVKRNGGFQISGFYSYTKAMY
jgi:hypothetical protein